MRKKFLSILLIAVLLMTLSLIACGTSSSGGEGETDETEETAQDENPVTYISVDLSKLPKDGNGYNVKAGTDIKKRLAAIYLDVFYEDGTSEYIPMEMSYISVGSRNRFDLIGTQQFTVIYKGCQTTFQLTLRDPAAVTYSLTVTGGIPVSVDGEAVAPQPIEKDGVTTYILSDLPVDSVVLLEWIEETDMIFDCWMCNGEKIDNQSVTSVRMTDNLVYSARSTHVIYSVAFETFKTNYNLASQKTAVLKASDIATLTMDDYVFVGWTEQEITSAEAKSGQSFPLVTFPFAVDYNTKLYAVWKPIRLSYTSYTDNSTNISGYQVVGYAGTLTDLELPATYNGLPILSVSRDTFGGTNATLLETIYIPSSVTEIEEGTFRECSSLRSITVETSNRVYSSEDGVLYKGERTTLVCYPANKVAAKYSLESNVTRISAYAFYDAVVGVVEISPSVTSVGKSAFDSVHIDWIDFSGVTNPLTDTGLPSKEEGIFSDRISGIKVKNDAVAAVYGALDCFEAYTDKISADGENGKLFHDVDTYLYSQKVTLLYRLINGTNEAAYFTNYSTSAEIIGVTRTVETMTLPERLVRSSSQYSVTSVGYYAFKNCVFLTDVTLPNKLERVCDKAFDDTPWADSLSDRSITAHKVFYKYLGDSSFYTVPAEIEKIAESAFANNKVITFVNLSDCKNLSSIAAFAFYGCENLVSADKTNEKTFLIRSALTSVGSYAFSGTAITAIQSESNSALTDIGDRAFADCRYLLNASFSSAGLETVSTSAFKDSDSLLSVTVPSGNGTFASFDGILYKITGTSPKEYTLFLYPAAKMYGVFNPSYREDGTKIAGKVTAIGENALYHSNIGALQLTEDIKKSAEIAVPGLVYIDIASVGNLRYDNIFVTYAPGTSVLKNDSEKSLFCGTNLTAMANTAAVAPVSFATVGGCLYSYTLPVSRLCLVRTPRDTKTLNIPESVTINATELLCKTVGGYAFGGYYLEEIVFERGVTEFAANTGAFAYSLKKVTLQEDRAEYVPSIQRSGFGPHYNIDLLIYVEDGMTARYIELWNANEKNYIKTFNYTLIGAEGNGVAAQASPFLIENTPFAVLTYTDDNGESVTVNAPIQGTITEADIASFQTKVQKDGYKVGGWEDSDKNAVEIGERYVIPFNQVLVCTWEPREYTVYLYVDAEYTLSVRSAEKITDKSNDAVTAYKVSVKFRSEYDWQIEGFDGQRYVFGGWRYDGKDIAAKGLWTEALDNVQEASMYPSLKQRLFTLNYVTDTPVKEAGQTVTGKTVGYGESYILPIPEKTGYDFNGWYYVTEQGNVMLTSKAGNSLRSWTLTTAVGDKYDIRPAWVAKVIAVSLCLNLGTDEIYKESQVSFDSKDFVFSIEDGVLTEEKRALFAGWADSTGVIYTDSNGAAILPWDKAVASTLYAVWPVEVGSTEKLAEELEKSMAVSLVLTADITVTDRIFGDAEHPYTGVLNGAGHTVTYAVTEDCAWNNYIGLFAVNEGTVRNAKFQVSLVQNIPTSVYNAKNKVYIGTVCAVNRGIIDGVEIEIGSLEIKVDGEMFCYTDYEGFIAGPVCAENTGTLSGRCVYRYYEAVRYYKNATATVAEYVADDSWKQQYTNFYLYKNGKFNRVTIDFNDKIEYYRQVDDKSKYELNNLADVEEAWDRNYTGYYLYDVGTDDYVKATKDFNEKKDYYVYNGSDYVKAIEGKKEWSEVYSSYYTYSKQTNTYYGATEVYDGKTDYYSPVSLGGSALTAAVNDWSNVYSSYYVYQTDSKTYTAATAVYSAKTAYFSFKKYETMKKWADVYTSYYVYDAATDAFVGADAVYDAAETYYTFKADEYVLCTEEAKGYYDDNQWEQRYSQYFTYDAKTKTYTRVGVPYDETAVYYMMTEDIFIDVVKGSTTEKMSYMLKKYTSKDQ